MSKAWFADPGTAERVPVWTRPAERRFSARPAGDAGGFAAWADDAEAAAAPSPAAVDPDAVLHEAFARGFDAGHAAAAATLSGERDGTDRLVAAIAALAPEPPADLARLLAQSVSRLVTQIVGEVAIDEALLARRTLDIAALVTEEAATARLRLHPDDVRRLDGRETGLELVPDVRLAPGTVVAETAGGWIEDGPAIRLERLRGRIEQLASAR